MSQGRNHLAEDVSRCTLAKLLSLVNQTKQLSVLLYLHDIV